LSESRPNSLDILPALKREDSRARRRKPQRGSSTRRRVSSPPPVPFRRPFGRRSVVERLRSVLVLRPFAGCGVFGVPKGRCIRSHSARHCIGRVGRSFDRPPHGPCHRPPSPLHHCGEARTPQGLYLVEPSPHPGVSGVGVREGPRVVPRRSERTSRLALRSVSVGRTPKNSHLISAIELVPSTTPERLSLAVSADEQYHEPSLRRCIPALKGEALAPVLSRKRRVRTHTHPTDRTVDRNRHSTVHPAGSTNP